VGRGESLLTKTYLSRFLPLEEEREKMIRKRHLSFILMSVFVILGCEEEWEGFVYPDKNNLTNHKNIGVYETLKECRSAAWDMLSRLNAINEGDYECGLNCEKKNGMSIKICEKTER